MLWKKLIKKYDVKLGPDASKVAMAIEVAKRNKKLKIKGKPKVLPRLKGVGKPGAK